MSKKPIRYAAGLAASVAVVVAQTSVGQAQQRQGPTEVVQAATRTYDIAPQSLDSAVPLFARQSGRQVTADAAVLQGLATQGRARSPSTRRCSACSPAQALPIAP